MAKVLITTGLQGPASEALLKPLADAGHTFDFKPLKATTTEDELIEALRGISATICGLEPYSAKVLAASPDLKAIARTGVGFDTIDLDAATRHGVRVCTTPGTNHNAVSELALGMMIAVGRGIERSGRLIRSGGWLMRPMGVELTGKTVAIIGCGLIGRTLAKRLHGFDCRLLGVDVVQNQECVDLYGVEYVSLEDALRQADFVSVNAPSMPETRHLINERTLALMKPTAFLINTARGPLIDEAALVAALNAGTIAGAALDVFETEPLPADSPLRSVDPDRLILTSHIAGGSAEASVAMTQMAVENVRRVLLGEPPVHCVNSAVLAGAG